MKGKDKGQTESYCLAQIKPDFSINDVAKNCVKYISVVQKEEAIGLEDLDSLQFDLEYILVNLMKRKGTIGNILSYFKEKKERNKDKKEKKPKAKTSETMKRKKSVSKKKEQKISTSEEKLPVPIEKIKKEFTSDETERRVSIPEDGKPSLNDKEKKMTVFEEKEKKFTPEESGKRMSTFDEKPNKKFKESSSKAHSSTSGRLKSKNLQSAKPHEFPENTVDIPKVQKNDSPNRFWAFVEPYCAEITLEDMKVLEDWIKSNKNDAEYQNIPPLGEHYASKWIYNDFLEELKEGTKSVECPKGLTVTSEMCNDDKEKLLKKVDNHNNIETSVSSLAERLVTSLVEGNLMTPLDDIMTDTCPDDLIEARTSSSRPSDYLNSPNLEKRLHKELMNLGLLEPETETNDADDELLGELKRLQFALAPVTDYNLIRKKKLLALAKSEMGRQEKRKKVQEADAKVLEIYRAIAAARSKGKKLSKKEQDQAFKMLKEREKLGKDLESMN